MKNLLPILLVLFVFASCKDRLEKTQVIKSSLDLKSVKAGPDPIPFELAKKMIENYGNHNNGISKTGNKILSNPDIAPIWLELDNLASLVIRLKNENADGIRVYFAKFGNNVIDEELYKVGLGKNDSYRNTIILSSTKDSLVNSPGNSNIHYHRDNYYNGAPLGFISSSSTMPGLKPIPIKLAEHLVRNYGASNETPIDSNGQQVSNIPNTSAIWLNLDKLESLVIKLKSEGADGVNIYFATYGDNVADESSYNAGLEKDYSYRNTIILVAGKESPTTNTNGVKINYHLDSFSKNEPNGSAFTFFTDPVNKGELCPPPSPCCSIGATLLCPPPTVN